MTRKMIILGAVGNCIDILDTINDINRIASRPLYHCMGFLDDDETRWGKSVCGVPILGGLDSASRYDDAFFINGIGSPDSYQLKASIISKTRVPTERFETIFHPSAVVSSMAELGRGVVVFQNVTIASNARIGDHVSVLPNSVISHDCRVSSYTCIAGGVVACGNVTIGASCYIGAGSSIKERVTVGEGSLVGMGSVVIGDVAEGSVVGGNPAGVIRQSRQ